MKDIYGYNGRYAVTADGKVWSHPKKLSPVGRFLKPSLKKTGYLQVILCGPGKGTVRYFSVHRLVAMAYLPKVVGKECVNHKNGVKTDNRVQNLEWCTFKENTQHAFKTGLHKTNSGKKYKIKY